MKTEFMVKRDTGSGHEYLTNEWYQREPNADGWRGLDRRWAWTPERDRAYRFERIESVQIVMAGRARGWWVE